MTLEVLPRRSGRARRGQLWRTLSARIILGYIAVIATFAVTTVLTVIYIADVGREIAVIRRGYLRLALESKDLSRKQEDLKAYLADDLTAETHAARVQFRLSTLRARRAQILGELQRIVDDLQGFPKRHDRRIHESRVMLRDIAVLIDGLTSDYAQLERQPPLGASPAPASMQALQRVRHAELLLIGVKVQDLATYEERIVSSTALTLEYNERRLRRYTIFLGCAAGLVGLLMTLWGVFNLSPIRRLRDAARRVAAGDYATRLSEQGPTEVSDLAREFNAMSAAIRDRELELVHSERLATVGKMAAAIAHEIRNPLSSIRLNAELLDDDEPETKQERAATCAAITREVDRLNAIVEDYLAFARLPSPRLAPEHLDALVTSALTLAREDLAARGIDLEVNLHGGATLVSADEGQIRQVILNLLRNAVEAVRERKPGRIVVETAVNGADATSATVTVRDNGPGFEPGTQERVFEAFFTTKPQGTGLGLALSRQIAREHHGDLRAESSELGATFVLTLRTLDHIAPAHNPTREH